MSAVATTLPDTKQLTGRQKAAIMWMVLGTEATSRLTQRLTSEEIEALTFEIARVDHVDVELVEAVMFEWLETTRAVESLATGGVDLAREILERAFGAARAHEVMRKIQAQISENASLQRLKKVDPQQLSTLLRNEHPQTMALILAHLDPGQTAAILKELPPQVGASVIMRMAALEKVSPDMLAVIERALGPEADLNLQQGLSTAGGPETVAAVLNLINRSLETELLEGVARQDPVLCEQIKNLMFVFEDITRLDARSMQRLLKEVETKQLALALKVASEELRDQIMAGMSKRAVEALNEEMEFLGPVRLRDVEAAQLEIVARVRSLEEAGEIVISAGGDDEVVS